jgi:hypothetical protein
VLGDHDATVLSFEALDHLRQAVLHLDERPAVGRRHGHRHRSCRGRENARVVILEAVAVLGLVAILAYAAIAFLTTRLGVKATTTESGRWRVAHFDKDRRTRVVVQKVTDGGGVLDEHLVDTIPVDDPEYDQRFLAAMSAARQRQALFESEEE